MTQKKRPTVRSIWASQVHTHTHMHTCAQIWKSIVFFLLICLLIIVKNPSEFLFSLLFPLIFCADKNTDPYCSSATMVSPCRLLSIHFHMHYSSSASGFEQTVDRGWSQCINWMFWWSVRPFVASALPLKSLWNSLYLLQRSTHSLLRLLELLPYPRMILVLQIYPQSWLIWFKIVTRLAHLQRRRILSGSFSKSIYHHKCANKQLIRLWQATNDTDGRRYTARWPSRWTNNPTMEQSADIIYYARSVGKSFLFTEALPA